MIRVLGGLFIVLYLGAVGRDQFDHLIGDTVLPSVLAETSVEVRDRNNQMLRVFPVEDGLWRLGVSTSQVDARYLHMLIAYEDRRFYSHGGVDALAMVRAASQAIWNGRVISGGSTLTMQVARLLENGSTGHVGGKLRQMRVALALERRYSKTDILNMYLIHAPFGGNLEGVRAATLAYFGKEPARLTPAEAALMIAIPQSPETRRPDRFVDRALGARERVVSRLADDGFLDTDTARVAIAEAIPNQKQRFARLAPHLADRARREVPERAIHQLTVDAELQKSLEILARTAVEEYGEKLSIAVVVMNHSNGEMLASVGSAGYGNDDGRQGFVDMTRAVRSPGSTLKPLIYGLAFDQGLAHPETLIRDQPTRFGSYAPQNFDGQFRGELKVSEALRLSLNIPAVLLTDALGPAKLMASLRASGAKPVLPAGQAGLAVALGGVGMTLEELVQLYGSHARGGQAVALGWRKGEEKASGQTLMNRSAAWQVGQILRTLPRPLGGTQSQLAYKTGTSYGHRDAWAIGYDGEHVIGVWMGRPDGTPVPGAFGGGLAAPVLFEAFQRVKPELTPLNPPPAETLMVSGGMLPAPLQRFKTRNGKVLDAKSPKVSFPPDGARLAEMQGMITLKFDSGDFPFAILVNGIPLATDVRSREVSLPFAERGASTFTVIDAQGRSDRVSVWLE